ncbi:unnamed protein product, partial [Polarella glacialis]
VGMFYPRGPETEEVPVQPAVAGANFSIRLKGDRLSSMGDRVRIIDGDQRCGSSSAGNSLALRKQSCGRGRSYCNTSPVFDAPPSTMKDLPSLQMEGLAPKEETWSPVEIDSAGLYRICWCVDDTWDPVLLESQGFCGENRQFVVDAGLIRVEGAIGHQEFVCAAFRPCLLKVFSSLDFGYDDQVLIVAAGAGSFSSLDSHCGRGSDGLQVPLLATNLERHQQQICYCKRSIMGVCDDPAVFNQNAGFLNISMDGTSSDGLLEQQETKLCLALSICKFNITGVWALQITVADSFRAAPAGVRCASAYDSSQYPVFVLARRQVLPTGAWVAEFSHSSFKRLPSGDYRLCYCSPSMSSSGLCSSAADFENDVGGFQVVGGRIFMTWACEQGGNCELVLPGWRVVPGDAVRLVETWAWCGNPDPTDQALGGGFDVNPAVSNRSTNATGQGVLLHFDLGRARGAGKWKVCLCAAVVAPNGCRVASDFAQEVGELAISGVLQSVALSSQPATVAMVSLLVFVNDPGAPRSVTCAVAAKALVEAPTSLDVMFCEKNIPSCLGSSTLQWRATPGYNVLHVPLDVSKALASVTGASGTVQGLPTAHAWCTGDVLLCATGRCVMPPLGSGLVLSLPPGVDTGSIWSAVRGQPMSLKVTGNPLNAEAAWLEFVKEGKACPKASESVSSDAAAPFSLGRPRTISSMKYVQWLLDEAPGAGRFEACWCGRAYGAECILWQPYRWEQIGRLIVSGPTSVSSVPEAVRPREVFNLTLQGVNLTWEDHITISKDSGCAPYANTTPAISAGAVYKTGEFARWELMPPLAPDLYTLCWTRGDNSSAYPLVVTHILVREVRDCMLGNWERVLPATTPAPSNNSGWNLFKMSTADASNSSGDSWKGCSRPCGGGVFELRRGVLADPMGGGTLCPTPDSPNRSRWEVCNTEPCPTASVVHAWTEPGYPLQVGQPFQVLMKGVEFDPMEDRIILLKDGEAALCGASNDDVNELLGGGSKSTGDDAIMGQDSTSQGNSSGGESSSSGGGGTEGSVVGNSSSSGKASGGDNASSGRNASSAGNASSGGYTITGRKLDAGADNASGAKDDMSLSSGSGEDQSAGSVKGSTTESPGKALVQPRHAGGAGCLRPGSNSTRLVCGDGTKSLRVEEAGIYRICVCDASEVSQPIVDPSSLQSSPRTACSNLADYRLMPINGSLLEIIEGDAPAAGPASQAEGGSMLGIDLRIAKGKDKSDFALVAGLAAGAVFYCLAMLGAWCLWRHRRRKQHLVSPGKKRGSGAGVISNSLVAKATRAAWESYARTLHEHVAIGSGEEPPMAEASAAPSTEEASTGESAPPRSKVSGSLTPPGTAQSKASVSSVSTRATTPGSRPSLLRVALSDGSRPTTPVRGGSFLDLPLSGKAVPPVRPIGLSRPSTGASRPSTGASLSSVASARPASACASSPQKSDSDSDSDEDDVEPVPPARAPQDALRPSTPVEIPPALKLPLLPLWNLTPREQEPQKELLPLATSLVPAPPDLAPPPLATTTGSEGSPTRPQPPSRKPQHTPRLAPPSELTPRPAPLPPAQQPPSLSKLLLLPPPPPPGVVPPCASRVTQKPPEPEDSPVRMRVAPQSPHANPPEPEESPVRLRIAPASPEVDPPQPVESPVRLRVAPESSEAEAPEPEDSPVRLQVVPQNPEVKVEDIFEQLLEQREEKVEEENVFQEVEEKEVEDQVQEPVAEKNGLDADLDQHMPAVKEEEEPEKVEVEAKKTPALSSWMSGMRSRLVRDTQVTSASGSTAADPPPRSLLSHRPLLAKRPEGGLSGGLLSVGSGLRQKAAAQPVQLPDLLPGAVDDPEEVAPTEAEHPPKQAELVPLVSGPEKKEQQQDEKENEEGKNAEEEAQKKEEEEDEKEKKEEEDVEEKQDATEEEKDEEEKVAEKPRMDTLQISTSAAKMWQVQVTPRIMEATTPRILLPAAVEAAPAASAVSEEDPNAGLEITRCHEPSLRPSGPPPRLRPASGDVSAAKATGLGRPSSKASTRSGEDVAQVETDSVASFYSCQASSRLRDHNAGLQEQQARLEQEWYERLAGETQVLEVQAQRKGKSFRGASSLGGASAVRRPGNSLRTAASSGATPLTQSVAASRASMSPANSPRDLQVEEAPAGGMRSAFGPGPGLGAGPPAFGPGPGFGPSPGPAFGPAFGPRPPGGAFGAGRAPVGPGFGPGPGLPPGPGQRGQPGQRSPAPNWAFAAP